MEHAQMSERHNPAAMLDAAFNGELSLDGEGPTSREEVDAQQNEEANVDQQATDQASEKATEAASTDAEPEGAPIASKSGTYTIPYEKLSQARDEAKKFAAENEQLKQQLAELSAKQQANLAAAEAQAQARADAGKAQTQADQDLQAAQAAISDGVDVAIFGDFSEEAIAKGIKTLQDQARNELRAEFRSELEKELAPLKQARAQSAAEAHYSAIYAKHADADEVLESGEFQAWRESLPKFVRAGVEAALAQGTAADVVEVFDSFKSQVAAGKPAAPRQPEVERRTVASLSEIAGAPPVDATQRTLQMADNPSALLNSMLGMTPEQIDALMNRV